jgi:phosphatidylserine/phosphatidylglycerophosphate/cardiolipin synthase-like enzyme
VLFRTSGEVEGFNAKVEALLGRPLPVSFIENEDPEAPIDFSAAPRLDYIFLSYLDYKADFSGQVIARLLRYHAARGTPIRVMVSSVMERDKDVALLEQLAGDYPNVQIKLFRWKPPKGSTFVDAVSKLHKVHHAKLLATLSREPGRTVAIIGGRNIHDGFLFSEPLDLSRYPWLQQYRRNRGLTLNYYSNWHDFDIAFSDRATVERLVAHFSTLWLADDDSQIARPLSIETRGDIAPSPRIARHFVSLPYADGRALEAYYAELIDAAQDSIEIVNPYLHLTPAIAAAFDRAVARGVKVTIIGRIDLSGDLGGDILTALNQMFANKYHDRLQIYDFKPKDTVLHGKILMIDKRLVVISSVNLNYRSFLHDSENGVVVIDRGFYARIHQVFESYLSASKPVDVKPISPFLKWLVNRRILREAL